MCGGPTSCAAARPARQRAGRATPTGASRRAIQDRQEQGPAEEARRDVEPSEHLRARLRAVLGAPDVHRVVPRVRPGPAHEHVADQVGQPVQHRPVPQRVAERGVVVLAQPVHVLLERVVDRVVVAPARLVRGEVGEGAEQGVGEVVVDVGVHAGRRELHALEARVAAGVEEERPRAGRGGAVHRVGAQGAEVAARELEVQALEEGAVLVRRHVDRPGDRLVEPAEAGDAVVVTGRRGRPGVVVDLPEPVGDLRDRRHRLVDDLRQSLRAARARRHVRSSRAVAVRRRAAPVLIHDAVLSAPDVPWRCV